MIKRPVLELEGQIVVGFEPAMYAGPSPGRGADHRRARECSDFRSEAAAQSRQAGGHGDEQATEQPEQRQRARR